MEEKKVETEEDWDEFFLICGNNFDRQWSFDRYVTNGLIKKVSAAFYVLYQQIKYKGKERLQHMLEDFVRCYGEAKILSKENVSLNFTKVYSLPKERRKDFDKKAKFICGMFEDIYSKEIKQTKKALRNDIKSAKRDYSR